MKTVFVAVCMMLSTAILPSALLAEDLKGYRADANQHYLKHNFKKAYKIYYKLAKAGDHDSQLRLAEMIANGEGKSIDLSEAYAWSVLAAESGEQDMQIKSDELLELNSDKIQAQSKAEKLKKKYGKQALRHKANKRTAREGYKRSGACTGSRLACARG